MPVLVKYPLKSFRFIFVLISFVTLVLGTLLAPPRVDQIIPFVSLLVIIGILGLLPINLFNLRYSLVNIILMPVGLIYGTGMAVWVCLAAIAATGILQAILPLQTAYPSNNEDSHLWSGVFDFGLNSFPLVITLFAFGISSGLPSIDLSVDQNWMLILGAGLSYSALHGILFLLTSKFLNTDNSSRGNWDTLALISIEIMPIFFAFTSLLIYPFTGDGALIILGVSTFGIGLLIFYLNAPWKNLERRLQELTALEKISKVLSSDIDLERLLSSIQIQVTGLLNVDNFYVALLDPVDEQIWYPLAVKHGARQNWSRRPLTDRLTDRVIQDSKPILLANNARERLSKIGLPSGEDAPYAWIGVPLITSEQTIGCLALFSMTPEAEFTRDDLNLLSILSGQTSVAIEIALHNALLSSDITIGRDRLTTILNSVHDGLILIDPDGKITLVNEAVTGLTGLPQSELIGCSLLHLPGKVAQAIGISTSQAEEILDLVGNDRNLPITKFTYKMVDRVPEFFVERSIIKVGENAHTPSGIIVNLRDITDEYQLKQAQDLISETLVHDLRSPLSSTISALDVISDANASGDPSGILEPSIQIAQRSSKRMLTMVESILEINRMETGRIELTLKPTNLEKLLQNCITEFYPLTREYNVSIILDTASDLPLVTLDGEKIQRVINNLIDNSLKFSPEGEEINVETKLVDQETIEVHVLDRGPGIPDEYAAMIFDRFFQIPDRPSRKRGSGLGLTYCRLAIEAHAGKIWVEKRLGGGSNFVISLPIAGPSTNQS